MDAEFLELVAPHRRELLVHCYRILGSFHDAEDLLQETLVRAWRGLGSLEQRAAARAWLYKIATHACLDALERSGGRGRSLPLSVLEPGDPEAALPEASREPLWLEPLPDALVGTRQAVALAFLTALQVLPPKQRAVLILRDVVGFSAQETADLLELSVAAANSALQRARDALGDRQAAPAPVEDQGLLDLLARYVRAWESGDAAALIALLRDDAAFSMPPLPLWFRGTAAIRAFAERVLFAGDAVDRYRLIATRANGAPAFGMYMKDEHGIHRPSAIDVLQIEGDRVVQIHAFLALSEDLFGHFGLPKIADRRRTDHDRTP